MIKDNTVKAHIGKEVAKRRKALDMTQEDLGKITGLSRTSIMNIESGRHCPPSERLFVICCVLKCTPNDLFPTIKRVQLKKKTVMKKVYKTVYTPVKM